MFPGRSFFFLLVLASLPVTAPRAGAADVTQLQFMSGGDVGPPALLREPARGAAEAQRGPRPGEARAAYGERVRRAGLAIGLTPAQANAARDFYLRRHAARMPAATPRPPASRWNQNQQAAIKRVTPVLRRPDWIAPPPERDPTPARRLLPSEAAARLDPSIAALMRSSSRRRVAAAVPPVREPAAKERTLPTAWQWMNGRGSGRGETRDKYYGFAAAYNRRADSITRESTGDSVGGWLSRKSYRFAAGASSIVGWINDDAAPGRIWKGLTGAVNSANAGLSSAVRDRPGQSAVLFLAAAIAPMPAVTRLASAEGDRRGKRVAASISRAAKTGNTWDVLDATYDTTTEVAEVASYATGVPAFMRRAALRESLEAAGDAAAAGLPRVAPRPWLTEAGTNDALAAVLETNYRRLDELNRQLLSRGKAGATKAELDAIRGEHWKLYGENARMQREIPELRDWFKSNPSPGTPGSRVFMEAVAANMGVPLATLPRGVRLASTNSLRRDLDAGAILPNPGKVAPKDKMTGSGAHLLLDGSPHMVSVAERLNGGIVLLMTGYADASRVNKTTRGILYEFEEVADAARLPEARQVFHGPLNQLEHMVPQVPMDRVRRVRFWNAELNPADSREILFDYTEPVLLAPGADAEAIVAALEKARRPNRFRVTIPNKAELASSASRQEF